MYPLLELIKEKVSTPFVLGCLYVSNKFPDSVENTSILVFGPYSSEV
jgi:hypothetical protein